MGFLDRIKKGWSAFMNRDPTEEYVYRDLGMSYYYRPDRVSFSRGNEKTIVTSVYNRIATDAASISIVHAQKDINGRFKETRASYLNECLTLSANKDQTGRAFIQDVVMSLFDEGCVAIVPIETDKNPKFTNSYDICGLRTAKIIQWYPDYVRVEIYNDILGKKEEKTFPKSFVAIVENPFYSVVNEPNSTLKRLIYKLNLLDAVDEKTGSNKFNMIIQLPYLIKTPGRQKQADDRLKSIEDQLANSKYGIAYTDGTEKVMQLNRPLENNLMDQIQYLTELLFSQLGITQDILNGTANEQVMINYYNRTIEPIMAAIADEMNRKFLTKTARTQGQAIMFFRDPFKLAPVGQIAEIADKFTRNAILSSNEVRAIVGYKPVEDDQANALSNKNINAAADAPPPPEVQTEYSSNVLPGASENSPVETEEEETLRLGAEAFSKLLK